RFRADDLAAVRRSAGARASLFLLALATAPAGNGSGGRRAGRLRTGVGSGRGGAVRRCFHHGGTGGLCRQALGLFLLALNASLFLGLAAGFFLDLAARFLLGALLRLGGVADLRFGERATARLDLVGRKLVQHHTDAGAVLLGARLHALRRRLGRT